MTITAGAGGVDSCDWTKMLCNMYEKWAMHKGFRFEILDVTPHEYAGFVAVNVKVIGKSAYAWIRGEAGVHRLVRISPFDSKGKRHTSFASVLVYPVDRGHNKHIMAVAEKDLRIDTFKASGAGGQHVNKTESAVRMTHLPTGITVECKAERSQIRNRSVCMELLQARLAKLEHDKQQQAKSQERKGLPENAWGSQIRSYVMHPYQMVKDSRTGHTTTQLKAVLNGEIDEFLTKQLTLK
ncbi:hypothetical protein GGF40_000709 [Coemansia sp. RSA 1286]|nr:hypothetical protein GGF40_000709 [Coemansia sp. RSA 1286]